MNLNALKVSTRLMLGFGAVTAVAVVIAALSGLQQRRLAEYLDEIANDRMVKVDKFTAVKDNLNAIARFTRNILISKDAAVEQGEMRKIAELRAQNTQLLAELDQLVKLPKGRELMKLIREVRPAYNADLDRVIALDASGRTDEAARLLLSAVREKQNLLFKAVDDSTDMQLALARELAARAKEAADRNLAVMLSLALLAAVAGGLITRWMTRQLSRQLGAEPADLSAAARAVAAGDLAPVRGAAQAPAGSVLAVLGEMQQGLSRIVVQVRASSDSIATGSTQIASGNADLSQRTEEQASALQQTAATMEQLGSTVRHNADNARQANQLAVGAASVAGRGGEVVGQVVSTMQGIHESSRRIGDIIGVIDGIAFQTNILALNAAVEAARAGEQGRGFAVVAAEVRTLARRSAEAAKEIKALIGRNVEQVEQGTALVDQAGRTMQEIVQSIQRVSDIVAEITSAAVEQSNGIGQVGEAVGQMDQVTQQNAALVEESAAAAESLRAQARQLVEVVSAFRLEVAATGGARPVAEGGRVVAAAASVRREVSSVKKTS